MFFKFLLLSICTTFYLNEYAHFANAYMFFKTCEPGQYFRNFDEVLNRCMSSPSESPVTCSNYPEMCTKYGCGICPIGTYSQSVTGDCTYQNNTLSKDNTCFKCSPGTWSYAEGSSSCSNCRRGYYCDGSGAEPKLCPTGTYRSQTGGKNINDCLPCPVGTYCNSKGTIDPSPCPSGTFQNAKGTTSILNCTQCALGFTSSRGSSTCSPCPFNTYGVSFQLSSFTVSSVCVTCPTSNSEGYGPYSCKGSASIQKCSETPCT